MDLRQLRALAAVAETGTYLAAAETLHIAQPAVWKQVRTLEDELGLRLFEKHGRRVRLTGEGRQFAERANDLVSQANRLRSFAADLKTGTTGVVRISCVAPHISRCLAAARAEVQRGHPDIRIEFSEGMGATGIDPTVELETGSVDLAVGEASGRAGVDSHPLYMARVVLPVAETHPWRRRQSVSVRDLRGKPLIVAPTGALSRNLLEAACDEAGFRPLIDTVSRNPSTLLALGASGAGIPVAADDAMGYLPARPWPQLTAGKRKLSSSVHIQWMSDRPISAAARIFRDAAIAVMSGGSVQAPKRPLT